MPERRSASPPGGRAAPRPDDSDLADVAGSEVGEPERTDSEGADSDWAEEGRCRSLRGVGAGETSGAVGPVAGLAAERRGGGQGREEDEEQEEPPGEGGPPPTLPAAAAASGGV